MKRLIIIFAVLGLAATASAKEARQGPVMVVFDIQAEGIQPGRQMLSRLSEYLAACFSEVGHQVVLREEMLEKMAGKGACRDLACRAVVADDLGANLILSAKILKFSGACRVVASMLSPDRSIPLKVASAGTTCLEKDLVKAVEQVAEEFTLAPGEKLVVPRETTGVEELETVMMDFSKAATGGNAGRLSVNSYPWGRVFIDGRDIGRYTPLYEYKLPPGRYMVTIRSPWNNMASTPVEIWPGQVTKLRLLFSVKDPTTRCRANPDVPWGL